MSNEQHPQTGNNEYHLVQNLRLAAFLQVRGALLSHFVWIDGKAHVAFAPGERLDQALREWNEPHTGEMQRVLILHSELHSRVRGAWRKREIHDRRREGEQRERERRRIQARRRGGVR